MADVNTMIASEPISVQLIIMTGPSSADCMSSWTEWPKEAAKSRFVPYPIFAFFYESRDIMLLQRPIVSSSSVSDCIYTEGSNMQLVILSGKIWMS
jgi:hypothetical protein